MEFEPPVNSVREVRCRMNAGAERRERRKSRQDGRRILKGTERAVYVGYPC